MSPPAGLPPPGEVPAYERVDLAPRRRDYCVGIPVLDEGDRIRRQLRRMAEADVGGVADVIVADGGSTDASVAPDVLRDGGLVRTLLTKTGPGRQGAQLRMFFAVALAEGYRGVVILDGNDKDGVEAIPAFVERLEGGVDYVQGSRYMRGGVEERTPWIRRAAVRWLHAPLLSLASGFPYTDTTNGFRGLGRRVLEDGRLSLFRHVLDGYNLHYYLSLRVPGLGYRVAELPVRRSYPASGEVPSKIGGWRGNLRLLTTLLSTVLGRYDP